MSKVRTQLLKFNYSWEILLLISILIFVAAKLIWAYRVVPFDPEEIMKLKFLDKNISPLYFFPGLHSEGAFYGHPGLWQAITYLFTLIFGNSIYAIRVLMLCTSVSLVGGLYYLCKRIYGRSYAFFCCLIFFSLPMFYFQSDLYFFELPSMLFGVLGMRFYLDRRVVPFFTSAFFAMFILESWVALPIGVLCIELFREWRESQKLRFGPIALVSLILILLLGLFFTWEYLATGNFSNHIVFLERNLSGRPLLSLNALSSGTFGGIFLTLKENFGIIGSGAIIFLNAIFLTQTKLIKRNLGLAVGPLIAFQVLTFFILFDAYSGGRDYYPVIFCMIAIALGGLRTFCEGHPRFACCALALWAISMRVYLPHNIFHDSSYQTTFIEVDFARSYDKLASFLEKATNKEIISCLSRSAVGEIICNSYFDPATPFESVSYHDSFEGDVAIFSHHVSTKWLRRRSEYERVEVQLPRGRKLNLFIRTDLGDDLPRKLFL